MSASDQRQQSNASGGVSMQRRSSVSGVLLLFGEQRLKTRAGLAQREHNLSTKQRHISRHKSSGGWQSGKGA